MLLGFRIARKGNIASRTLIPPVFPMDLYYMPPATQSLAHRQTVREGTFDCSRKVESTVMSSIKMTLDVAFSRIAPGKRRLTFEEWTSKADVLSVNLDPIIMWIVVGFR
jgi:hypothetical protein